MAKPWARGGCERAAGSLGLRAGRWGCGAGPGGRRRGPRHRGHPRPPRAPAQAPAITHPHPAPCPSALALTAHAPVPGSLCAPGTAPCGHAGTRYKCGHRPPHGTRASSWESDRARAQAVGGSDLRASAWRLRRTGPGDEAGEAVACAKAPGTRASVRGWNEAVHDAWLQGYMGAGGVFRTSQEELRARTLTQGEARPATQACTWERAEPAWQTGTGVPKRGRHWCRGQLGHSIQRWQCRKRRGACCRGPGPDVWPHLTLIRGGHGPTRSARSDSVSSVSSGCVTNAPTGGAAPAAGVHFLTVLRARCQQGCVPRGLSLARRWPSSPWVLTGPSLRMSEPPSCRTAVTLDEGPP